MTESPVPTSPPWGATIKLVVALTIVAILAGLFIQFHAIIGPLLMALVLAYLFHPVAGFLQRNLHSSWPITVALIYFLVLVFLLSLLTLGGVGLIQQIQSLVAVVQDNLTSLPDLIQQLSGQVYQLGPFKIDFRTLDLQQLSNQLLGMIQPLLGSTGSMLSAIASGAAQFLGWALFVLLISYFILSESGGLRKRIVWFDIPGYAEDIRRLGHELGLIWNAFLRGQIIIFFFTALTYTIVLSVLGVRYAIGIAFLAGLAKFVPYVGPFITWTTLALVAYFQPFRPFGLNPLAYTLIAVVLAVLIDQIFDNIITPRIIAQALQVHPAAVLVAAIIAANLLGLLGVVVAAPMLATILLLWRYTMRKMLDLNPWPEPETQPPPPPGSRMLVRVRRMLRERRGVEPKPD
jgi:predicted PurR-regulated permease PerM